VNAELRQYDKDHCWQYEIRLQNKERDLQEAGFTQDYAGSLRVSDFMFVPVTDDDEKRRLKEFIHRHEWLGNISQYTTHWFGAYHHGILAGALLFNMPNAFSKLLGKDTPELERLISRGACISWSPKNLASAFIMWCVKWMSANTQYRLFTAYSDPMAKELGTVYQACNFYYLGQNAGAQYRYINPYSGKVVSDRFFRQRTAYKKYAKELEIKWESDWCSRTGMLWENIPVDVELLLRHQSKLKQSQSQKILVPAKHKYAMIRGANRKETAELRTLFESLNKTHPYPKSR